MCQPTQNIYTLLNPYYNPSIGGGRYCFYLKTKNPSLVWSKDSRSSMKIIYGVGLGKQTNKLTPNLSVPCFRNENIQVQIN